MTLANGTRLGAYEILEPIGAGGMGEVYKAKDTRIDRTVAIKVLPSGLADDAALKQRFEREARSISSLSHPHICTLYEFDSHDGTDFLVMEHLEGESLAARIARKGALPFDTALRYGIQIADALDGAHRQGVVHRDLKPGNIMLTDHGAKLLDFGLARMIGPQTEAEVLSAVPTQAQPLTEKGAILGTFQYMSPEQLEGEEADARTDVFAFGAVLYEMVTGKKAFEGKTQASLIAAILEREPEAMSTLQPITPVALERVVKKCLAKKPVDRYHSMHDLADELRWTTEGTPSDGPPVRPDRNRSWMKAGIGFALGVLVAGLAFFDLRPDSSPRRVARFTVELPESPARSFKRFALAPTGNRFAYVANDTIYVRELDQLEARPLSGTAGGPRSLAFSPDGEWVAFSAGQQIKKVAIRGGGAFPLGDVGETPLGIFWGDDDFLRFGKRSGGVWQLPGGGGTPELVLSNTEPVWRPQLLPDGRTYLFSIGFGNNNEEFRIAVQSPEDDAPRVLFEGGDEVRYLPTGHLVFYVASNDLVAVPFDASRLELIGSPAPVVAGSDWQYDVSRDGTMIYLGREGPGLGKLVWVARNGGVSLAVDAPQAFSGLRISPDGRRVAVEIRESDAESDLWVYDLERGTRARVTTDTGLERDPVWTPNGERIVFGRRPNEFSSTLVAISSDGTGDAVPLLSSDVADIALAPSSFTPDGRRLAYWQRRYGGSNIGVLDLENKTLEPFVVSAFSDRAPAFSPDGRFIAYDSNASGQPEVYVQAYPGPGERIVISTDGGFDPTWSSDGKELFYRVDDRMMAVRVETEPTFKASVPVTLFEAELLSAPPTYDVAPDGQRFLMIEATDRRAELHVVLNWVEELKARVPVP